mmetsp:Transcript_27464/g.79592  ORF Transcript_27464/g.79592 Transcript_27464/m.79592 type:complete len:206 (-) Transcript_27464:1131-1748(-)
MCCNSRCRVRCHRPGVRTATGAPQRLEECRPLVGRHSARRDAWHRQHRDDWRRKRSRPGLRKRCGAGFALRRGGRRRGPPRRRRRCRSSRHSRLRGCGCPDLPPRAAIRGTRSCAPKLLSARPASPFAGRARRRSWPHAGSRNRPAMDRLSCRGYRQDCCSRLWKVCRRRCQDWRGSPFSNRRCLPGTPTRRRRRGAACIRLHPR